MSITGYALIQVRMINDRNKLTYAFMFEKYTIESRLIKRPAYRGVGNFLFANKINNFLTIVEEVKHFYYSKIF